MATTFRDLAPVTSSGEGADSGRPDPGTLARGVWEAPPWAFYAGAGIVVVAALVYAAHLAGLFRRRRPPA